MFVWLHYFLKRSAPTNWSATTRKKPDWLKPRLEKTWLAEIGARKPHWLKLGPKKSDWLKPLLEKTWLVEIQFSYFLSVHTFEYYRIRVGIRLSYFLSVLTWGFHKIFIGIRPSHPILIPQPGIRSDSVGSDIGFNHLGLSISICSEVYQIGTIT